MVCVVTYPSENNASPQSVEVKKTVAAKPDSLATRKDAHPKSVSIDLRSALQCKGISYLWNVMSCGVLPGKLPHPNHFPCLVDRVMILDEHAESALIMEDPPVPLSLAA